jgi:dienelactone hydrolase
MTATACGLAGANPPDTMERLLTAAVHDANILIDTAASPDNALIACIHGKLGDESGRLQLIDVAKAQDIPLPPELARGQAPTWSPDGQRLAWVDRGRLLHWDRRSGKAEAISGVDLGPDIALAIPRWTANGKSLLALRMIGPTSPMALKTCFVHPPEWPKGTIAEVYAPMLETAGPGAEGAQVLPLSTMPSFMGGMISYLKAYTTQAFPARLSMIACGTGKITDLVDGLHAKNGVFILPDVAADSLLLAQPREGGVDLHRVALPRPGAKIPLRRLADCPVVASSAGFAATSWSPSPGRTRAVLVGLRKDAGASIWLFDAHGQARHLSTIPDQLRPLPKDQAWIKRFGFSGPGQRAGAACTQPPIWSPDESECYAVMAGDLWAFPLDGSPPRNLTTGLPGASAAHGGWWSPGNRILVDRIVPEARRWQGHAVSATGDQPEEIWDQDEPTVLLHWTGVSRDVLLLHEGRTTPPEVQRLPRQDRPLAITASPLTNPWLSLDRGRVATISYAIRGNGAEGLLLSPANRRLARDGRLPLIIIPYPNEAPTKEPAGFHGLFESHARMLVAHGYAVLRPAMPMPAPADALPSLPDILNENLDAALDAALATGNFDPARIGLFGWSYGAYAVYSAMTRNARFAVAVAGAGFADPLVSYLGAGEQGMLLNEQYLGGKPWDQPERYRRASLLPMLDRIRTPLLIVHGLADTRVSIDENTFVYRGLAELGRPVVMARYRGDCGHSHLRWPEAMRHDFYGRLLRWYDHHLCPPDGRFPSHH